MNTRRTVWVIGARRSAIGSFGGSLKDHAPIDLAATIARAAIEQSGLPFDAVEQCVFGQVIATEPADLYLARVIGSRAGLPESAPAMSVNRLCGSGLQAIVSAAQQIELGLCDSGLAGGVEVMSRAPYLADGARFGNRMGDGRLSDMLLAALHCPLSECHMGITAENLAERWDISREEQDELALRSHQRAAEAQKDGRFAEQIVPVSVGRGSKAREFAEDEHVRSPVKPADFAGLKPAFKPDGTVTAGNASGINDGAAALVLAEAEAAKAAGCTPLAQLVGYVCVGVEPKYMGIGPVPAVKQLLEAHKLDPAAIDVWEINEAFAAQVLAVAKALEIPPERLNPNGSGIALGHPVGATGAIITVKALAELARVDGRYAVVALCIGGGQGIAALFERV